MSPDNTSWLPCMRGAGRNCRTRGKQLWPALLVFMEINPGRGQSPCTRHRSNHIWRPCIHLIPHFQAMGKSTVTISAEGRVWEIALYVEKLKELRTFGEKKLRDKWKCSPSGLEGSTKGRNSQTIWFYLTILSCTLFKTVNITPERNVSYLWKWQSQARKMSVRGWGQHSRVPFPWGFRHTLIYMHGEA